MGATKIINVLKDDKFEELLEIVREADASEVIFVLPKNTRAFKSEDQFAALEQEAKKGVKSVTFLCSNPEVNELAKKYNFDILSTKTESSKLVRPKPRLIAIKNDNIGDMDEEITHDEFDGHRPTFEKEVEESEKVIEEIPIEDEEAEYKEEETESATEDEPRRRREIIEDDPPYGTELDESGNTIYDEKEEIGEEIISKNPSTDFQILTASAKTRGMSDVVKPSESRNVKIIQKDKGPVKIETYKKEEFADLGWGNKSSQNIWADIAKPRPPAGGSRMLFFRKRGFNLNPINLPKRGIGILSIASILIVAFIIFLTTGSARIEIKPRSQELGTQLKVTMSPNFSSVDNSFNRIPGQLFTISKSASNEFNATAEKDAVQKSKGTMTIYNEYSTSPQPLVATTRFEYIQEDKESEFVFRTLQSVTVPGMKVENGVVTPGKINVEVIADKAGQNYNISAGTFGIMAWREKGDNARYEKIYGRSNDSMHGGILGKAKVISEFDYNNAKDRLTAKVNGDVSEALREQSAGMELLTGIEPKIDSIESTAETDDAVEKFTMTVNSSITTIGFKKEDLLSLISNHIDKTSGLIAVPEKLELSYKDTAINPTNNTLEVAVVIGGRGYAKIEKADIMANLMGKNKAQIKGYLSSIKNIDSAKVILSPFWVKKIPRNENKIDIFLMF